MLVVWAPWMSEKLFFLVGWLAKSIGSSKDVMPLFVMIVRNDRLVLH